MHTPSMTDDQREAAENRRMAAADQQATAEEQRQVNEEARQGGRNVASVAGDDSMDFGRGQGRG